MLSQAEGNGFVMDNCNGTYTINYNLESVGYHIIVVQQLGGYHSGAYAKMELFRQCSGCCENRAGHGHGKVAL